jgi:hypothetical protein
LRQEQRRLQRAERDLREAEKTAEDIDDDLAALLIEAATAGLTEPVDASAPQVDRDQLDARLHRAVREHPEPTNDSPATAQDARRHEVAELAVAEDDLDQLMAQRALLLDESEGGSVYADALEVQLGRLTSINLLPLASDTAAATQTGGQTSSENDQSCSADRSASDGPDDVEPAEPPVQAACPVCGQHSAHQDPAAD